MKYFVIALACVLLAWVTTPHASEVSEQIKRACALRENMQHPVCVKRAEQRAKAKAAREKREQEQLDSILGPVKPSH